MRRFLHKLKVYTIGVVSVLAVLTLVFVANGLYHANDPTSTGSPIAPKTAEPVPKAAPPKTEADNRGAVVKWWDRALSTFQRCSVREQDVVLTGEWHTIAKAQDKCLVVIEYPHGTAIEAQGRDDDAPFAVGTGDIGDRLVLKLKLTHGDGHVTYSLCSRYDWSGQPRRGRLDFNCKSLTVARQ